jgi:hypothetical protein
MPIKKKPEPGDVDFQWGVDQPVNVDQLIADAKISGLRADRFSKALADDTTSVEDSVLPNQFIGTGDPNANGFLNEEGSVFDSPLDKLARLSRQIVRPIPGAAKNAATIGSFVPGPVGAGSRAVLGGLSGLDLLEGGGERVVEHPYQTAADVAGVLLGAGELAPARKGLDLGKNLAGQAKAYEGAALPMRPWPAPRGAAPEVEPGSAIEKLMNSPSFQNLSRGAAPKVAPAARSSVSAMKPLAGATGEPLTFRPDLSGPVHGPQSFADAVREQAGVIRGQQIPEQGAQTFADAVREQAAKPAFKMNAEGAFGGDRSVRGIGGLEQEGTGGLRSLALKSLKKKPGSYSNPGAVFRDMEEGYGHGLRPAKEVDMFIPSVKEMDPMERLAARSRERFGKKYRRE